MRRKQAAVILLQAGWRGRAVRQKLKTLRLAPVAAQVACSVMFAEPRPVLCFAQGAIIVQLRPYCCCMGGRVLGTAMWRRCLPVACEAAMAGVLAAHALMDWLVANTQLLSTALTAHSQIHVTSFYFAAAIVHQPWRHIASCCGTHEHDITHVQEPWAVGPCLC